MQPERGRDLDAAKNSQEFNNRMADFLGWKPRMVMRFRFHKDGPAKYVQDGWITPDGAVYLRLPDFLTDANAARLVLAEIERRGVSLDFVGVIDEMTHEEGLNDWEWAWKLMNASPEAICLAALTAVRGGKR